MRLAIFRKRIVRPLLIILIAASLFLGIRYESGNQGAVESGRIYRSAQLSPGGLKKTIADRKIQTVVNLRGSNPDEAWYCAERDATLEAGAVLVDVPIASDQWLSRDQAKSLLHVFDTVKYPALIHCEWGAERSGLVCAMAVLLRTGSTVEQARHQFSLYYLFLDVKDGRVMYGHLRQYERWLSANAIEHAPATFRRWLLTDYKPEGNSRENWPCNPYPLEVVTRRSGEGKAFVQSEWSANRCPAAVADRPIHPARR
jgi:protein tyrosine/serine phosphatase